MRIVIVTDAAPPQVNGVVITLGTLARELGVLGHEVHMITPQSFRTMPCPTYPEIRLALFPGAGVRRALEALAPDAVHIATEGPLGIAARRVCVRRGWPFTTSYHTRFPEYVRARAPVPRRLTYAWLRRFHGRAVRTLVPTASMQSELVGRGFDSTVIWPRGVDIAQFTPAGPRAVDGGMRRPVFAYVGRVAVEKNIEAFLRLSLPGSKWVIGGGPQLRALAAAYPEVRFEGPIPHADLAAYYRCVDVFVFPSLTDTFGLVLLEALACGVPVAAFPVTGPVDVIGADGPGVLDPDLGRAACAALAIPRAAARAHAERYSWERVARLFAGFLAPIPRST
ncbi:MAG: glycosyltransferase family 1 protein [Burkholderiales bacterium]|nr:glycosyltransferase family 1 protein [Burkholderiales bacterium]